MVFGALGAAFLLYLVVVQVRDPYRIPQFLLHLVELSGGNDYEDMLEEGSSDGGTTEIVAGGTATVSVAVEGDAEIVKMVERRTKMDFPEFLERMSTFFYGLDQMKFYTPEGFLKGLKSGKLTPVINENREVVNVRDYGEASAASRWQGVSAFPTKVHLQWRVVPGELDGTFRVTLDMHLHAYFWTGISFFSAEGIKNLRMSDFIGHPADINKAPAAATASMVPDLKTRKAGVKEWRFGRRDIETTLKVLEAEVDPKSNEVLVGFYYSDFKRLFGPKYRDNGFSRFEAGISNKEPYERALEMYRRYEVVHYFPWTTDPARPETTKVVK